MEQKNTTFGDFLTDTDSLRQQQTQSAQSQYYGESPVEGTSAMGYDQSALHQSMNSGPLPHSGTGHLSPLEIIDQADDDLQLLQALEGLTLDTSGFEDALGQQEQTAAELSGGQNDLGNTGGSQGSNSEHIGEHGTRSEFIKDAAERLITRVNAESDNIDQAKQLMQHYLMEFCAVYDQCGYSQRSTNATQKDLNLKGNQSENSRALTDRTSTTTQGASASSSVNGKSGQQKSSFENQILKKGVRVLSKNLQRANELNRVKDQQLKVMKNILVQQKTQMANLQAATQSPQTMQQHQTSHINTSATPANNSPSNQLTGMMDQLNFNQQTDSSMMGATDEHGNPLQSSQRAITNRSLHLQSMKTMQNFPHTDSNHDIY